MKLKQGDTEAAKEAFTKSSEIVKTIVANVSDEKLKGTFLNGFSTDYADLHNLWSDVG